VASTDHDLPLKLKVSALFRQQGYVSFNEVDLCTYTYQGGYKRKQVTDFDVLGIRVEPDLATALAVAECKTAEERAMENLLKLNGVKEFFHAYKAYFVQQRIDVNAREIGRELGIMCLDAENLASLLGSLGVKAQPHVETEAKVYAARTTLLKKQKSDFPTQADYLRYDFWTLPSHRSIINLVRLLAQMAREIKPASDAHVILAYQLTTALALATVRVAGEIVRQNINNFPDGLLTTLLGGSRERRDREALFDTIATVVKDSKLSIRPGFFEPYAELVGRYLNAMIYSHQVIACLDAMTRERLLPEIADTEGSFLKRFPDRTVKLARDALHFVIDAAAVPSEVFANSLVDGAEK
jgi:hypothetical protein